MKYIGTFIEFNEIEFFSGCCLNIENLDFSTKFSTFLRFSIKD